MALLIIERNFVFKLTFSFCIGNVSLMDITTSADRIAEASPYAIIVSDDKSVAYLTRFGVELARFDLHYWDGRHTATLTALPMISHSPSAVSGGSSTVDGAIVNSLDLLIYAVNNLAMMFAKD